MKTKQTQQKRLTLEDFKMQKIDGASEIDNLLGGTVAASCHKITITQPEGLINKAVFDEPKD